MSQAVGLKNTQTPLDRIIGALREDVGIFAFVAALLIARIVSADRHSYWLDELFSVYESGSATSSFRESISKVASDKVHPPLYEAILYFWMQIFGHSENSTRGLSSVLMALAAIALYYIVKTQWSKFPAFLSAAGMSLTAGISEYALESRNYAQLTFLTVFSALMAIHFLRSASTRTVLASKASIWWLVLLGGANTALLLTHYYSVFWIAAQAIFVFAAALAFSLRPWRDLLKAFVVAYILPVLLFAGVWGWVLIEAIERQASRFQSEAGPSKAPWEVLTIGVLEPNVAGGVWAWSGVGVILTATIVIGLVIGLRGGKVFPSKPWLVVFLGNWLITPLVFVWIGYSILGSEIYHPRYFIYVLPPLIPLLVIAVWETATKLIKKSEAVGLSSGIVVALFASTLLLPPTSAALARDNGNYRGVAQEVVATINADPENSYLVISTNRGQFSLVNYYFERFSDSIRAETSVPWVQDLEGGDFELFRKQSDLFEDRDYVIVVFTFDGSSMYPNLLQQLDERFTRESSQLTSDTRGYIVWKTANE